MMVTRVTAHQHGAIEFPRANPLYKSRPYRHAERVSGLDIGVYLPQVGFSYPDMLYRARRCEHLGIGSMWLYDHLVAPGLPGLPSLEAWTLATALLSNTERLRIGHLVLCNQFRHPALLATMACTLDQISGGRLQLGLGSGSIESEHTAAGLPWGTFAERSARLAETLQILHQGFASGTIDFHGHHYDISSMTVAPGAQQKPRPPIVIGGVGEKHTLPLVARYADVWNVPTYALGQLPEKVSALRSLCAAIGRDPATITMSVEAVMALVPDETAVAGARAMAEKRFGDPGFGLAQTDLIGTPPRVVDRLHRLQELGFDQVVLFTHDRASDTTLELLAGEVIGRL